METQIQTDSVILTSSAAQTVRNLLADRNLDTSYALRVFVAGKSCSGLQYGMALDNKPLENDASFETDGVKILVDDVSFQYLHGAIVDFVEDERGKGFLVQNPNAQPSCSCEDGSCGTSGN